MKLILAIVVAMTVAYFLSRRNRECRILSRILYSNAYERACRLHREAMVRFTDEEKRAGHPDIPPAPRHERAGETITLRMFVEALGRDGSVELRCYNRNDRLSYRSGQFTPSADSDTTYSRFAEVHVQGVIAEVDRPLNSITLMPSSVDNKAVGEMRLVLR